MTKRIVVPLLTLYGGTSKFSKILSSKYLTIILLMLLVIGAILSHSIGSTQAFKSSNVMYFVPQSLAEDHPLSPEKLNDADMSELRYFQEVGHAEEWNAIRSLVSQGQIDVLIIPHEAQDEVDWDELKLWFFDGLVVVGVGIPGDELASLLGNPRLYTPQSAGDYDYRIYAMRISGHTEDIQKLREAGFPDGPVEGIKRPLSGGYSSGGDYLTGADDDVITFLRQLDGSIHRKNLPKLSPD